jgi:MFS family permease
VAWLIVARVVQALGAALLTPASLSIILDAFPKEKRTVAVSLWLLLVPGTEPARRWPACRQRSMWSAAR